MLRRVLQNISKYVNSGILNFSCLQVSKRSPVIRLNIKFHCLYCITILPSMLGVYWPKGWIITVILTWCICSLLVLRVNTLFAESRETENIKQLLSSLFSNWLKIILKLKGHPQSIDFTLLKQKMVQISKALTTPTSSITW